MTIAAQHSNDSPLLPLLPDLPDTQVEELLESVYSELIGDAADDTTHHEQTAR